MKICPKCAAENTDTAKFCNECGTALEIKKTEILEIENNPEPVLETPKVDVSTAENAEAKPVKVEETATDGHKYATEQTEKKEESSPKKNNRLIIGIVAVALIFIVGFIATRPRLKSLEVTYTGDTTKGIVLDNNNDGFKVTAVYSNGQEEDVPAGEWQITEPKTLVADSGSDVTVTYNGIKEDVHIECSTTVLQYLTATYNGPTYEDTEVNRNSDITVTGHFKKEGFTQEISEGWYLDPETVTLKAGETSKVTVKINGSDGNTYSADLEITGTEKPFTRPEIEGDHYNCTIDQFVKYVKENTNMSLFEMNKMFGDEYECFGIVPPKEVSEISDEDAMVLALRENEDGKLWNINIWAYDKPTGMATSLQYAKIVDRKFNANDETQKVKFVTENYYASGDIAIIISENNGAYFFMILNHDQAKDAVDKLGGSIP